MRFHVAALPQADTTYEFSLCGFSQKTIKFCWMMKSLGHTVFLYGGPKTEAWCDEYVQVVNEYDQVLVRELKHYIEPSWNPNNVVWKKFNKGIIEGVKARRQPGDIVCILGGACFQDLLAALDDMPVVEYGIGYVGFRAKHLVWENAAWKWFMGQSQKGALVHDYDPVIAAFFNEDDFAVSKPSGDLLFVGRVTETKGIQMACKAAKRAGKRLLVAGHGNKRLVTDGAVYLGEVSLKERNRLMSEASALLCPTTAFEANGNVAIEAQLCGTPVISTNWGGFVNTVIEGQTGWRIRDEDSLVAAIGKIGLLDDRRRIRQSAIDRFSVRNIRHQYDRYFRSIVPA